jgi:hypothetical protein
MYLAALSASFIHTLSYSFGSICISVDLRVHVLVSFVCVCFNFVNYVFLLLCLCVLNVMYVMFCVLFHCIVLCIVYV